MKKLIAAALMTMILSGCSSMMSIGSPEYACSGMPEGVTCVSARDVYTATESDNYQTQLMREQQAGTGKKGTTDTAEEAGTRVLYREAGNNAPVPTRAQNPLPIRTQAVVMRIAVDPWEDENGDLYVPGYIYTEIEPRRWEIGSRATPAQATLKPLSND